MSAGTATAQLYPVASGDAVVSVTNLNPFPVKITQVAQDVSAGKFVSSTRVRTALTLPRRPHPTGVSLTTAIGSPLATITANTTSSFTLAGPRLSWRTPGTALSQGAVFAIPVTVTSTS